MFEAVHPIAQPTLLSFISVDDPRSTRGWGRIGREIVLLRIGLVQAVVFVGAGMGCAHIGSVIGSLLSIPHVT